MSPVLTENKLLSRVCKCWIHFLLTLTTDYVIICNGGIELAVHFVMSMTNTHAYAGKDMGSQRWLHSGVWNTACQDGKGVLHLPFQEEALETSQKSVL